ncbi:MAG: O-antigen ligase family protein [Candidatus Gracilibacteria bacterium]
MQKLFPRLIALFPLLFPLYFFRGDLFGVPVTFPELTIGFLFLLFLFYRDEFRLGEWKLWAVGVFFVTAIVSLFIVPDTSLMMDGTEFPSRVRALGIFKGWILAPMLYFVMARSVFREKPGLIAWALRAMLVSGVALSAMALWQVLTGSFATADARASGPFESANYLALYLGPLVVYSVFALIKSFDSGKFANLKDKIFLAISVVICFLALYFTDSYASYIALTFTFACGLLLFLRKKNRRAFYVSVVALIVLGAGLVASQIGSDKFEQALQFTERSSSSVRVQVYTIALYLIKSHPLLGIGLGQFEQQYQEVANMALGTAPYELNMLHPHNIFLAMWLSLGFFGLVAFVAMCFKALAWLFENDKKERSIVALMLIVILIHGLFDTPYFKNDLAFQFWLIMAILL